MSLRTPDVLARLRARSPFASVSPTRATRPQQQHAAAFRIVSFPQLHVTLLICGLSAPLCLYPLPTYCVSPYCYPRDVTLLIRGQSPSCPLRHSCYLTDLRDDAWYPHDLRDGPAAAAGRTGLVGGGVTGVG